MLSIFLFFSVFSGYIEASTNACFDLTNKNDAVCGDNYKYDTKQIFYKDSSNVEQAVFVNRVFNRGGGSLAHTDFNYQIKCGSNYACTNDSIDLDKVLWGFRNAIKNDRLYEYRGGKRSSDTSWIEKANVISDSILNIVDTFETEPEFSEKILKQSANGTKVLFDSLDDGYYKLTIVRKGSNTIEHIPGSLTEEGNAEFVHDKGQDINKTVFDFLWNYYVTTNSMTCNTRMNCETHDRCSVMYQCN